MPAELGELVARMLAREPRHRPRVASVREQLDGLLRVARGDGPSWGYAETDAALAAAFCEKPKGT